MKKKYNFVIEKLLFYVPFIMFILYTNIHFLFAMKSNSEFISLIIDLLNALYMKGPFIFLAISLILAIYIFINGSKKYKLIMFSTIIGCALMYYNLLDTESFTIGFITTLLFVSSYLIGIFYTLAIAIYLKNRNVDDIKKKIIKGSKAIVIYLGISFLLAYISNTNQYSYDYAEQGLTGWIRSTNGLGHALVFLLPFFILSYLKERKNSHLFYIVIIIALELLIGTKACYFGIISTLFITILYLFIDFLKKKKYHYFKLLSLFIVFMTIVLISNNLYVVKNITQSLRYNTDEYGRLNLYNFVTSNRDENLNTIKPVFNESDIFTKTFGLGLYYPKYDFIYIEYDLYDLLYIRGFYGLILYVGFFGVIIFNMFKRTFKDIKERFDIDLVLMFLTIGFIVFSSFFVGHVIFNLMPLTVVIMIMAYYITNNTKLSKEKIKKS